MKLCYVDEAGCLGRLPTGNHQIQPAFVLGAIVLEHSAVPLLTQEFLELKRRFFPGHHGGQGRHLDRILAEIKGSELRRDVLSPSRRTRRSALGFLDKTLQLLEAHQVQVIGKVLIKGVDRPMASKAIYTSHIQYLCECFNHALDQQNDLGMIIADSRKKSLNSNVAHSIFTLKYKTTGDAFPRLAELPVFGHSDNHAGLQLADLLVSALVFPMATSVFCASLPGNIHVHAGHQVLTQQFGQRIKHLQYRFQDSSGRWRGGLTVADHMGQQSGGLLFG